MLDSLPENGGRSGGGLGGLTIVVDNRVLKLLNNKLTLLKLESFGLPYLIIFSLNYC